MKKLCKRLNDLNIECWIEGLGGNTLGIVFPNTDLFITQSEVEQNRFHITNGEDNREQFIYFSEDEAVQVVLAW